MKKILMMAITLDGKIAQDVNQLADWTSKADKKIFVKETKDAGVIVMGKTTYDTIGRPLPNRLNLVMTFNPDKEKNIPGVLEYTNKTPAEIIAELKKRGFKKIIIGGGTSINSLFLKEGLIDEIWLTVEPKIFGTGLSLFKVAGDYNLELLDLQRLNDNVIHLRYKFKN